MRIHVYSETQFSSKREGFTLKGNGVHTAFVDHVELLKSKNDIEVVVNNEGRGDIYHCHTWGLYYFLKGIGYKNRRIHTVHVIPDSIKGSLPMYKLLMPVVKWYFKRVYSYADVCIAISPTVENAIRALGAKTDIVSIYNPINTDKWKRTPENRKKGRDYLGLNEHDFVVLGVGQLIARKGVEDFIDIAGLIPEAKFIWTGGRMLKTFSEGVARIDARIESAPENIKFTGMLDLDIMPEIYAAADLMLFPSYQENCPLAPIEAAASGIPVVFRDIPEYTALYDHYYLKAGNNDAFANMTRKLMNNKTDYENGVSVSKQLIEQFDKEVVRSKLIDLYQSLTVKIEG
ncbi:MAG: glycosyltransferase family 4 protein [Paludibacter sp.]|nr:glycosyltransferase family 4 protein [Paludibacter sp.]